MTTQKWTRPDGSFISYEKILGTKNLAIIYLHGFISNQSSFKGQFIKEFAAKNGFTYLGFDQNGHGESSGNIVDWRIGKSVADAQDIIRETLGDMPVILVGSSMGGWVAFLVAERLRQVKGVIGLAAGVDFLRNEVWEKHLPEEAKTFLKNGGILTPEMTNSYTFSYGMFTESDAHLMLARGIRYGGPVILIHGDRDKLIPVETALKIKDALDTPDVVVHLIKGGEHSLGEASAPALLVQSLDMMIKKVMP